MSCLVAPGTSNFEQPTFGYIPPSYSWAQGFNQRVGQKFRKFPRFRASGVGSLYRTQGPQSQQTQYSAETRREIFSRQVSKFVLSNRDTLSLSEQAVTNQNSSTKTYQFRSEPVGTFAPSSTYISAAQTSSRTESRAPDVCSGGQIRDSRSDRAPTHPSAFMDSPRSLSEASSPEPTTPPPTGIARKKKEIVDNCMAIFENAFDRWLDNLHSFGHGNSDGDGASGPGSGGSGGHDGRRTNKRTVGQKRQLSEDRDSYPDGNSNGDEDGDDNQKGGGGKRVRREETAQKRKFACPFYKHNPRKYTKVRTCCGPGWDNVHRMKEHLYRSHLKPKHACARCYKSFPDDAQLKTHLRQPKSCDVLLHESEEGFDEAQEKKLRERSRGEPEPKKWEEVYRILFPKEPVPTPYYDDDAAGQRKSSVNGFDQYEQYLRREMPLIVRRGLEMEIETKLHCVEEEMKEVAVEIFRNAAIQLLKTYTAIDHRLSPSPEPLPGETPCRGGSYSNSSPSTAAEDVKIPDPETVFDDPNFSEMFHGDAFNLEPFIYPEPGVENYDGLTSGTDLAYWTTPVPSNFVTGSVDNV